MSQFIKKRMTQKRFQNYKVVTKVKIDLTKVKVDGQNNDFQEEYDYYDENYITENDNLSSTHPLSEFVFNSGIIPSEEELYEKYLYMFRQEQNEDTLNLQKQVLET